MAENTDIFARVADMVKSAESYRDDLADDRVRAMEYYDGTMKDTPSDAGRSKVVSRDVRAAMRKVLPSIVRTILGGDEVVEYAPFADGDEEMAAQSSDYVNYVILPESNGRKHIKNAIFDALLLRNGILRWWWDERTEIRYSQHTGLLDEAFSELVADDSVEPIEHTERSEVIEAEGQQVEIRVHDVRIRRALKKRGIRIACVPREEFLIHPDALEIDDSPMVGIKTQMRRSDLVAMGYDRDVVDILPHSGETEIEETEEDSRRDISEDDDRLSGAMQEIDYYELFVRDDQDGDGIAELRLMCFAGSISERGLLRNDPADEVQMCAITTEDRPHQWEGQSIADDTADMQQIKTVLLRQTLDNLYWQNNPQPSMQEGAIENPEAVYSPEFGLPIRVKAGFDVRAALAYLQVPFVADKSFSMLEYLDREVKDRTGISDAAGGLPPDALQNMTAKATAIIEQMGVSQVEERVRTVADGLKALFRGILRLLVKHQDVPRTVRLRDEWVTFDPRQWNADMDVSVNTGLGAGSRERDMMVMGQVMAMQEKILAQMGADNPFVKPDNLYNGLKKLVEATGLRTPGLYFTKPDPKEVEAKLQALRNRPDPKMEEAKMRVQADMAKAKMDAELEARRIESEMALKREQMASEIELKREQMAIEARMQAIGAAMDTQTQVRLGGQPG